MGDFHLQHEFVWAGSTWVQWNTLAGTAVFVLLRNPHGDERCIRHFQDANQFDSARQTFDQFIGPKIDADVSGGSVLATWQEVTKHHVPDEKNMGSTWTYVMSWDARGGGALVIYHLNPPGYQYDEPFVGSDRQRDWWDQSQTGADLHWPGR
jgi:hypothetical protein